MTEEAWRPELGYALPGEILNRRVLGANSKIVPLVGACLSKGLVLNWSMLISWITIPCQGIVNVDLTVDIAVSFNWLSTMTRRAANLRKSSIV